MRITDLPIFIQYIAVVSILATAMTAADKISARKGGWRISEKALLTVAVLGGALGMYITMLLIRHKTKHPKFMVGLPLIIVLETAAIIFLGFLVSQYNIY